MDLSFSGPLRWIFIVGIFLLWVASSFLTQFMSKAFIQAMDSVGEHLSPRNLMLQRSLCALVLTILQLGLCLYYIGSQNEISLTRMKFGALFYAMGTLSTNLSLSMLYASATFTIKLMEPITTSVLQYVFIGTALIWTTKISLPFIVGGAIVFAGNPFALNTTSYGIILACIPNICISMRNIAVKQCKAPADIQKEVSAAPHKWRLITFVLVAATLVGVAFVLETGTQLLPAGSAYIGSTCCLSAICHVSTAAISVSVILKVISVVSHAIANVSKRLLVVLLLYVFGRQTASFINILGFVACAIGLLTFAWGKKRQAEDAAASSQLQDMGQCHDLDEHAMGEDESRSNLATWRISLTFQTLYAKFLESADNVRLFFTCRENNLFRATPTQETIGRDPILDKTVHSYTMNTNSDSNKSPDGSRKDDSTQASISNTDPIQEYMYLSSSLRVQETPDLATSGGVQR